MRSCGPPSLLSFWCTRPHLLGPLASRSLAMVMTLLDEIGTFRDRDLWLELRAREPENPVRGWVPGHRFAERSCRLILPLARRHGFDTLWITCNPDNVASRRTCERLGAELVGIVDVPPDNDVYERGSERKCRYRLAL